MKFRFLFCHDLAPLPPCCRHAGGLYDQHEHWRLDMMTMKFLGLGAAIFGASLLMTTPAMADWHDHDGGGWGGGGGWHDHDGGGWRDHDGGGWHDHGGGGWGGGYYPPPPVYYAPPPRYYYPPPPPVYYAPPPPQYYAPPGIYITPGGIGISP
jgi:hypothetical protein